MLFIGFAGGTGLAGIAGFACLVGICAVNCFTGLVDLAVRTGFARLAVFAGLLALSALFLSECVELSDLCTLFVVPPGRRLTVAGTPAVEADQVGAAGCELLGYRVCFGGGEVGGWASLP